MNRLSRVKYLIMLLTAMTLLACWNALAKTTSAPQKYFGRSVLPQEAPRPHPSSLDVLYPSTDVPRGIPDGPNGIVTSELPIPDNVMINDLNVLLTITHTWIRDLRISLIAPESTEVVLLDLFPGDSIVNMTDTWFDDEAAVRIDSGAPPFTGSFRPQNPLSVFDGMSAQGTWTLRVMDRFPADTGRIEAWAIEVNRPLVLSGTVVNRVTRLPLAQVKVEALPSAYGVFTNAAGIYGFDQLTPGAYALRFSKQDYDSLLVPDVVIVEGQVTVVDTSLYSAIQFYDFASTSPPMNIPDADAAGAQMNLAVSENVQISDLDVTVNLTHTWIGDISLYLISPQPDTLQLVFVGESCLDIGQNMTFTVLDDEASEPFSAGEGPFTGSWQPYEPLAALDNMSTAGAWSLWAVDNCAEDIGSIQNFTLHVQVGSLAAENHFVLHPSSFILSNYPNPFNASTEFRFSLSRDGIVELALFDVMGRRAATVTDGFMSAGEHIVSFNARALPSGIYFARLSALSQSQSHKVILLK